MLSKSESKRLALQTVAMYGAAGIFVLLSINLARIAHNAPATPWLETIAAAGLAWLGAVLVSSLLPRVKDRHADLFALLFAAVAAVYAIAPHVG